MVSFPALEQPLNPFPHYEAMRRSDPVSQDRESGVWHVFGYGDVQRVLSDHATFSSRFGGDNPSETGQLFAASLINTDPPRHRQLRSLVTQAFTPRAVEALASRIAALTEASPGRWTRRATRVLSGWSVRPSRCSAREPRALPPT